MCSDRLRISGGFWLLLGWFALLNGWGLLFVVLGAAALHELGHVLVLRLVGASIRRLRLTVCGAAMETDADRLPYGWELAAVLAGPGTNLLWGLGLLAVGRPWCRVSAGAHLALCAFNLLPMRPLDGGRALLLLSSWLLGPRRGEGLTRLVGGCTGLLCSGGLLWLMRETGGNLWLLPGAAGLLAAAGREWRGTGDFL